MSTLRVMLVRHGETASNVHNVLDSRPPGPPLNEQGRSQAAALVERLAGEPVVAVYASVATRAQETAAPVAAAHGLRVTVLPGVHEVDAGDLDGTSDAESLTTFADIYRQWVGGDMDVPQPGGESGTDIRDRYFADIATIRAAHQDGLVVLLSHGGVIRLAAEWLCDNVGENLANAGLLPNTGHVLLEAHGDGWHCLEWTNEEI